MRLYKTVINYRFLTVTIITHCPIFKMVDILILSYLAILRIILSCSSVDILLQFFSVPPLALTHSNSLNMLILFSSSFPSFCVSSEC